MEDYPVGERHPPTRRWVSVVWVVVLVAVAAGFGGVAIARASSTTSATRAESQLPTRQEALDWVAAAEAQLGYSVGDPCPAPDENAPPLADSPLMGMAGGDPCRIMYWVTAQPDMPALVVDGDGNVTPMFHDPPATDPTGTDTSVPTDTTVSTPTTEEAPR